MNPVLSAAQSAFERVGFYSLLYRTLPDAVVDVPFITSTHYHRADGALACIDSSVEICGVLPPFHREFRRLPFSVLESDADIDQRQERLGLALKDTGFAESSSCRILMITAEVNGPFACDLSTGLGWEGHPASIYYWGGAKEELRFQIEAHQPDWVFWCIPREPQAYLEFPEERTIVAHSIDEPLPDWPGALWLFCDELNLIGSRPAGRSSFRVAEDQLLVETGPAGRPCLTTLKREIFPLVRYGLANNFEVLP